MRRWLFRLHLCVAVLAGAFFALLGLTGSILAFESPLDHLLHPRLSYVDPSNQYRPVTAIIGAVKASYPSDDVVAIDFSDSPMLAWQVIVPSGVVYINPHTGRVLGLRQRGETILGLAQELHVSLAAGSIGRTAVRWVDAAGLLLIISGFALWWPRRILRLHRLDGTRRSWSDLHNAVGILSILFVFVASATGAVISMETSLRHVIRRITGPESAVAPPSLQIARNQPFLPPDQALSLALSRLPGESVGQMTMPEYGGTYGFTMIEHHHFASDIERRLSLDPWSGATLYISRTTSGSLTDRMLALNEGLHTGSLFGVVGRTIMALAGGALLPQAISGLIMLWKRTRKGDRLRMDRQARGNSA